MEKDPIIPQFDKVLMSSGILVWHSRDRVDVEGKRLTPV
jgi:hypothetical protein